MTGPRRSYLTCEVDGRVELGQLPHVVLNVGREVGDVLHAGALQTDSESVVR